MNVNLNHGKFRSDRPDGRLFLTDENLDRGALTLLSAARRIEVRVKQAASDAALTPVQLSILMELRHTPGLDVAELRQRLGGTIPTIARVLGELDQKGLIIRPRNANDGRKRALQLSGAGDDLVNNALTSVRKHLMQVYRQSGEPSVSGALELLEAITAIPSEQDTP